MALWATLGAPGEIPTWGGPKVSAGQKEAETVRDLLDRCLAAQSRFDHVSMNVETEIRLLDGLDEDMRLRPLRMRDSSIFRRDGKRLDHGGRRLCLDRFKDLSYKYRAIVNDKYWVYYQVPLSAKTPTSGAASSRLDEKFQAHASGDGTSSALDGYLGPLSGGKRLPELLKEQADPREVGREDLGGIPCRLISGETRYGIVTLWVAESRGYNVLKFTFEKQPRHFYDAHDQPVEPKLFSGNAEYPITKRLMVLDQVELAHADGGLVPVRGRLRDTIFLGGSTGGHNQITEYVYKRSNIDLSPDFAGIDAFVTDLAEGATVHNDDEKPSGVVYMWKEGEVQPAYAESAWDRTVGFFGGRRFLAIVGFLLVAATLLIIAYRWGWRRRAAG